MAPPGLPEGVGPEFQRLFDATPMPYLVLTPDFTMVAANDARLRATLTTREQILGRNLFEVFPDNPADPAATGVRNLRASLARVLQNKCPDAMPVQKYDIPTRGEVEGEFEVRYWKPLNSPVFGPTGEVAYIIHSVEDVTEHILKQQAVEESEARFRLMADAMPQMVWSALPDGYHDYYNRQHYEFSGMPVGATIGQNWGSILHPDDLPRTAQAWEHSLASGDPYETEYRLRHRSGEYHWMLARALPIRNQDGLIERWIGTCTDIHAQKVLRANLQDAQLRLEGILTAAEVGTWTLDIQANRVYADRNCAQLFEISEEDARGGPLDVYLAALHPDDRKAFETHLADTLAGRKPFQQQYRLCHHDGSIRYIHARGKIEVGANGEPVWMTGVVLDITQQKVAEEARQRTEFQFKTITDSNVIGVMQYRFDGRIVKANDALLSMLGYSRDEFERGGLSWRDLTPPEWEQVDRKSLDVLQATGSVQAFEKEYIRKDGSRLPVYIGASNNYRGKQEEGIAYVLDISEIRRAQSALRESEVQFRTLAENIPQLAWMADSDGAIFWYNNRWFEYTGTTLEQMRGWGWERVHHPDFVQGVKARYRRHIVEQQVPWEDLFPLRSANGEYRWFLSRALPIRDQQGRIVRWFGTNTDITIQREAEEALEAANRRKDEFLAMLAHELRNPLAPISTAANLLTVASPDKDTIRKYSEIISRQVRHMTELVDDLLDVSRVTRGLVSIEKSALGVKDVIHSAIEQSAPLIDSRKHVLSVRLDQDDAAVLGDRTRLIQVLTNLLNNAAKYTPLGGHILLCMEVKPPCVCISIADDGIGMDAQLLPHVFDLFTQAERTPDRSQGGLGLGLALVRSIMTLHGGNVTAKSEGPGKGSTFTLSLPVLDKEWKGTDGLVATAAEVEPGPLRILAVDDNVDAAESLAALLRAQGHDVTIRENAHSAIEEAESLRPDALILDIGLPDMDGYELSRRLHGVPATRDALFIALTGYGQAHDKVLAKAAGFQHFFVKPVDMTALRRALAEAVPASARTASG